MRMRVIHFVPDVSKAEGFYEALGLRADLRSRTGTWVELIAAGGELDLHNSASAADGEAGGLTVGSHVTRDRCVDQRREEDGRPDTRRRRGQEPSAPGS